MTFSIVAVDVEKKEAGFAIASCCWNSGMVCRAEVEQGAIASQANGNLEFLDDFFHKIEAGWSLKRILDNFKEYDEDIETRQVGMVNAQGNSMAFTGTRNSHWCGHISGNGFSIQGNILKDGKVLEDMATAFSESNDELFERLFSALDAGDDAGGDARGKQSARLCVKKKNSGPGGSDILIDIVIEDHDDPVKELGRILEVRRELVAVYRLFGRLANASKAEKLPILEKIERALEDRVDSRFIDFWEELGDTYYQLGEIDRAVHVYRTYLSISPAMRANFRENAKRGTFPEELAERLGL